MVDKGYSRKELSLIFRRKHADVMAALEQLDRETAMIHQELLDISEKLEVLNASTVKGNDLTERFSDETTGDLRDIVKYLERISSSFSWLKIGITTLIIVNVFILIGIYN